MIVLYLVLYLCFGVDALKSISSNSVQKVRFRCRVAYDGTSFFGFQLQCNERKEQRTVQGELEAALYRRFQRPIRVVGAGRTDAGVHSRGQAIHFDLYDNETITPISSNSDSSSGRPIFVSVLNEDSLLQSSMNRMLPQDIRVWNVQTAPLPKEEVVNGRVSVHEWNVMRKCDAKLYSYRLCIGDYMDPIERHGRWQLDWGHEIDPSHLSNILKSYEGTHDFRCFAGALEQNERKTGKRIGTVRKIHSCKLVQEQEPDLYRVDIYLEGALYKMVRNLVGTALDVCRGRLTEQKFKELLFPTETLSRKDNPSKPAPSQGLTLEHVFYPDDYF